MRLTFFGQSGFGFESCGARLVIDPYPVSEESRAVIESFADATLSHVLVTHAGFDHLGIALDLVEREPSVRLVADIAVVRHALRQGLPDAQVTYSGWNVDRHEGPWHFRGLEAKHASVLEADDGYVTGMPLGFLVWHDNEPDVRIFHLGDTSIFSDLTLFGQLYDPMVAIVNVRGAMTPEEASLAVSWLGVDIALPVHFGTDRAPAERFCSAVEHLPRTVETWVPEVGATYSIERTTHIMR